MLQVRKTGIIRRATERLGLEGLATQLLSLVPFVFLTSDTGDLLKDMRIEMVTNVDPGATGYHSYWTVPPKKRWKVYGVAIFKLSGTSIDFSSLVIGDEKGTTFPFLAWSATTEKTITPDPAIPLKEGWTIAFGNPTYTAGDKSYSRIYYEEEDAY